MKPNYIFFYRNDMALDDIIKHAPFCSDSPVKVYKSKNEARFEYEHFDLRCFKKLEMTNSIRGLRTCQVLVEDELYDAIDQKCISELLSPMMTYHNLIGGRIVRVEKYPTLED
jgi:hypothetical protein